LKGIQRHFPARLVWRLLLPLLLVSALAAPASSQAWSSPMTVSAGGGYADSPQVAVDQSGTAILVWRRRDGTTDCNGSSCFRVQGRVLSAGGGLSSIQTLSASGQTAKAPQVAVDKSGNSVFVWQRYDGTTNCGGYPGCLRIEARARTADGALSPVQTLSAAGQYAEGPQVGVDAGGNAAFVWRGNGQVWTRARLADGALSPIQAVSAPGQETQFSDPQIAVDSGGDAVFVWEAFAAPASCNFNCTRAQTRTRSADGTLSPVQTLSAAGADAIFPQVAVDQSGNAVFVWQRCGSFLYCSSIQARARSTDGVLSPIQTLSAGNFYSSPQVSSDRGGDAVFVWSHYDETADCGGYACLRIQARARSADGALSPTQVLSAAGQFALYPQVALDPSGTAVFVWERFDGTTNCARFSCLRIQARTRSAAGALDPTQTLSAPYQNAVAPQVAVDPSGDSIAAWQQVSFERIQAATGP
jgi:uncharacterized protein YheU (UPF0270 family)